MSLRVVEWNFRNKGIESYYTRLFQPSVVAIQEGLSPEVRRLAPRAGGASLRDEAAGVRVGREALLRGG